MNALRRRIDQFRASLSLTYLRFLRGDAPHQKVRIALNDEVIEPWDPFGEDFGTEVLLDQEIPVEIRDAGASKSATFRLRAFALPPRSELTREQRDQALRSFDCQPGVLRLQGRKASRYAGHGSGFEA